jgi:c-di-GMP-binding flagellar brake protein YcgR
MYERRKYRRFDLNLESQVIYRDHYGVQQQMQLSTRDISCKGVFLLTNKPLEPSTSLELQIILPIKSKEEQMSKTMVHCEGKVVRTHKSQGMAVHFDKKCQIFPLEAHY